MTKTIVFCADGTWNSPGRDDDGDGLSDPTNVYKLFFGLEGAMCAGSITHANEQEKELLDCERVVQVAKYIHGLGDSRNPIRRIMGGAFGAGMISRIVRGYTFISRNYEPRDSVVIVGFSRGAYTARALTGLIASQGVLAKHITQHQELAYRAGANAWYRYRKTACSKPRFLPGLLEAVADLPAFVSCHSLMDTDFVAVASISAVGVWDTVGALGLPHYIRQPGADAFKFADTKLSVKVRNGFHAVALDEQRLDFTPTLWDSATNVTQVAFPGAHADVGGGYTASGGESGLSDTALAWMVQQLTDIGVRFTSPVFPGLAPDEYGVAHKPWLKWPFNDPQRIAPRSFPAGSLTPHASIARRRLKPVCHGAGEPPGVYSPNNCP